MEKPSAQTKGNFAETLKRVIKDIENLEKFYESKVLAIGSRSVSASPAVHFGSKPTKPKEKNPWHPKYIYGRMASDSSSSSDDGSWFPERDEVPNTPMPKTARETDVQMRGRWGPPSSVNGNNDYSSSVLKKEGYL
jgi:hypothetical protein